MKKKKNIRFSHTLPKWWRHRGFWEQTKQFPTNGNPENLDLPRFSLVMNCFVCSQKASVTTHFGCLGWNRMRNASKWRLFRRLFIPLISRLDPVVFVRRISSYAFFEERRFGLCIAIKKKLISPNLEHQYALLWARSKASERDKFLVHLTACS